jgi:hypothetical protein
MPHLITCGTLLRPALPPVIQTRVCRACGQARECRAPVQVCVEPQDTERARAPSRGMVSRERGTNVRDEGPEPDGKGGIDRWCYAYFHRKHRCVCSTDRYRGQNHCDGCRVWVARRIPAMLTKHIQAALRHASYAILADERSFYGEIPVCNGVYANATTLENCR